MAIQKRFVNIPLCNILYSVQKLLYVMSLGSLVYYIMKIWLSLQVTQYFNVVKKGSCDGLEMLLTL